MTEVDAIPVIVVGGFLGSGKTTLINNLVRQANGLRVAALINDFGAMNIDAELVVGVEGTTIALANGCVCCTIRDDLAKACIELLTSDPKPEALIVELSGVSAPGPVLATFLETELRRIFVLSSVVVVVDTLAWNDLEGSAAELFRDQLRAADLVALSKTDLSTPTEMEPLREAVRQCAPDAPIRNAPRGALPLETILDATSSWVNAPSGASNNGHGLKAYTWTSTKPLSLPRLEDVVTSLPPEVYRCKGFVWLEEFPKLKFLLQAVGWRYDLSVMGPWAGETPCSILTTIRTIDAVSDTNLDAQFSSCIGTQDLAHSPVLRLVHKLAPELLQDDAA